MKHSILAVFLFSISGINAQGTCPSVKHDKKWTHPMFEPKHGAFFEFGVYSPTIKGTGLTDFDISDSKLYGLKALDSNSNESRYRIPVSGMFPASMRLWGISIKLRWNYGSKIKGGIIFNTAGDSKISMSQFGTMFSPVLLKFKRFRLLSEFEFGTGVTRFEVDDLQPLPGYYKIYRGENGFDLKPGQSITIKNKDRYLQGGLTLQYALARFILLYVSVSGNLTQHSGKMTITSPDGEKLVWGQDPVQVSNELSSAPSPNNISFNRTGLIYNVGISLNLFDNHINSADTTKKRCSCCGQIL